MELGLENRKQATWALVLGALALFGVCYEILPLFWGPSTTANATTPAAVPALTRSTSRTAAKVSKKLARPDSLDPTLQLQLLASSEQIKYSGSGRNIFVSRQEDVTIEKPKFNGTTDHAQAAPPPIYVAPAVPIAPPIPLKFFGFASGPGEPKRIFLSKDQDVFIAGEGEIIDRRYKVVRISANSVEMQDLVVSGPPQPIPLTQNPS